MTNQAAFGELFHQIIDDNVGGMCDPSEGDTLEEKQFYCYYSLLGGSNDWGSWNHQSGEEFPNNIYLYLGEHDIERFLSRNDIEYLSNQILRVYIRIVKENYTNIQNEPLIEQWKTMLYNEIFDEFRDKVI